MPAPTPIRNAHFLRSVPSVHDLPAPTFSEIVFAGKSNVGKSSLLNALLGHKALARVSSTPGCTRGINLFEVELGAVRLHFVDLPGYGYAQRSKRERLAWGPMIEGYFRQRVGIGVVAVIVDVRRGLDGEDRQLLEFLDSLSLPAVVVATKLDKLSKSQQKPAIAALGKAVGRELFGFSSVTHQGQAELLERIGRVVTPDPQTRVSPSCSG